MSVKAVHIEVVSDLTTDAFLSCLRHFIARRGKPKTIMSDHGTNFVGADRELKNLTGKLRKLPVISVRLKQFNGNKLV